MRAIFAMVAALTFAGCAGFDATPTTVGTAADRVEALSESAEIVQQSLAVLGTELATRSDSDLGLAWSDLESDVRSVIQDLMRDPDSVDTEGMKSRVESFAAMVAESSDASLPSDKWEEFVTAFSDFVDEASGSA